MEGLGRAETGRSPSRITATGTALWRLAWRRGARGGGAGHGARGEGSINVELRRAATGIITYSTSQRSSGSSGDPICVPINRLSPGRRLIFALTASIRKSMQKLAR